MSLIADSLKKIEKGENDAPKNDGGFIAPPLMQKDFGGGGGFGKGGGKKSSRSLIIILVGVVVVIVGGGAFLYMSGMLDSFLEPEAPLKPIVAERPVRTERVPEQRAPEETTITLTDNESAINDNEIGTGVMSEGANAGQQDYQGDIFETESAQDMSPAASENITASARAKEASNRGGVAVALKPGGAASDNKVAKTQPLNDNGAEKRPSGSEKKASSEVAKKSSQKDSGKSATARKTATAKSPSTGKKTAAQENKGKVATVVKGSGVSPKASNTQSKQRGKAETPKINKPVTFNDKIAYTSLISQGENAADRKDYVAAIDNFTKASEIENSNVLMGNIAALYIKQGKPAVASEIVVVNKINDPSIVSGLIIDMSSNKHFVQALVLLKYAAANIAPDSQLMYAEGYYYEMQRGYVKAAEYYNKAFEMNPREPAYLYSYARCLDFSEQYYKALAGYTKVIAMKPDQKLKVLAEQRVRALQGYLRK